MQVTIAFRWCCCLHGSAASLLRRRQTETVVRGWGDCLCAEVGLSGDDLHLICSLVCPFAWQSNCALQQQPPSPLQALCAAHTQTCRRACSSCFFLQPLSCQKADCRRQNSIICFSPRPTSSNLCAPPPPPPTRLRAPCYADALESRAVNAE